MEFPVSPKLDQFSPVEGGVIPPPGLPADSQEVMQPWQLHSSSDGLIDEDASHMDPSDCYTDDSLFYGEEHVGPPFDDNPLSYSTEYADVVANEYSAQDDFKLTESEKAELVNAYTTISNEQAAEVGLPFEHHVLPCGVSSDDESEAHMVPTPVRVLAADHRRGGHGSDEERAVRVSQRKSYFRAVADDVGFNITDPDTITSHDKSRCYVDCLEDYVQWLEEQIRLVGLDPLPLERVPDHGGLTNRSLRIILVHMQEELFTINLERVRVEGKFMDLQSAILARRQAVRADEPRLSYLETGSPSRHIGHLRAT